jgi:hypothetical protein
VCAYLSPSELGELRDSEGRLLAREQVGSARLVPVFLLRAEAVKWGLWPASKSAQVTASEASPSPDEQPNAPAVGIQAATRAQSAPEQPEAQATPEPTTSAASSAPGTLTTAADQQLPAAGGPEPSQSPQAPQQPPVTQPDESEGPPINLGGRPTDRDLVVEEAAWRLRQPGRTEAKKLAPFARELRKWLEIHGEHRAKVTGEVMKAETIEDHVRSLWNSRHR